MKEEKKLFMSHDLKKKNNKLDVLKGASKLESVCTNVV